MAAGAESPLVAAATPFCRSCFQRCRRNRPARATSLSPFAQAMAGLEIQRSGEPGCFRRQDMSTCTADDSPRGLHPTGTQLCTCLHISDHRPIGVG